MQKNNPNKKKPCTNDKGTDCKRKPIIFFSMKRCVVTDNLYKMSFLLFGHACTAEITKQIHRQKTHVVKCLIVWHGPLILNIVNESVYCLWEVWPQLLQDMVNAHSQFVNSFVMIYLIRSEQRVENKKKFMLKVQVFNITVAVYFMLLMLPDLVIVHVCGLCF